MERIAICITTHNRRQILDLSLRKWNEFLPENAKIFVVDDGSKIPVNSDFRFEKSVGIANAKNKCLELAEDFDHIFLVDDDVMPKVHGWEKPYIESGLNHLCLTFDRKSNGRYYSNYIKKIEEDDRFAYYTAPNGCMLYLRKKCLQVAGGMRPDFGKWGFEHVEYSQRIHNFGLTPMPYIDVKNSLELFDVLDWRDAVKSSISTFDKSKSARENLKLWNQYGGLKEYVPYKRFIITERVHVHHITPARTDKNFGKAINQLIEGLPDNDWVCLRDIDTFPPDHVRFIEQVEELANNNQGFDLIGCMTNRIGLNYQLVKGMWDEMDLMKHRDKAKELSEDKSIISLGTSQTVGGVMMLFSKSTWLKVGKFPEGGIKIGNSFIDYHFSMAVARNRGKLGIARGIYLYHNYRIEAKETRKATGHLV